MNFSHRGRGVGVGFVVMHVADKVIRQQMFFVTLSYSLYNNL